MVYREATSQLHALMLDGKTNNTNVQMVSKLESLRLRHADGRCGLLTFNTVGGIETDVAGLQRIVMVKLR